MTKLTIPQIRERLHELAVIHGIPELSQLATATYRRQYTRAPTTRKGLDEQLKASIRAFVADYPGMAMQDVANTFGVNPGRVSEALHGKRGEYQ
jgi:hypothetical protein